MNKLIAYTYDFVSYFLLQPEIDKFNINQIILFGSAARGDFTKESDIDLFIDVIENDKNMGQLGRIMNKIKDSFFESERMNKWKILGIKNDFSIIIGRLKDSKWRDLRENISLYGIVLFQRYIGKKKGKNYVAVKWYAPKQINIRVKLARKLYGYKQKGKFYEGMLKKINAILLGGGAALIPLQHLTKLTKILKELKIKFTTKETI